jgi:hypothetical protein
VPNTDHDQAQLLSSEAALAKNAGRDLEALDLFGRAAELEGRALTQIPDGMQRTWGILAVSHAALLYKAHRYGDAERALREYLARRDLLPFAREQC